MTYNPPYYPELVAACGFSKEKDLLSFWVDRHWQPPPWVERLARRISNKVNIQMRPLRIREDFRTEMEYAKEIYHEAWFDNWGFVPMTDAEWEEMGHSLARIHGSRLEFFYAGWPGADRGGSRHPGYQSLIKTVQRQNWHAGMA